MARIQLIEQVGQTSGGGLVYSWSLCGVDGRTHRAGMVAAGWRWVRRFDGIPGCWYTTSLAAANRAARILGVTTESNGSHEWCGGAPMAELNKAGAASAPNVET